MQDFKIDFVKRSIDILNKYNGEYPFSNLINCTLGLIILPFEKGNNEIVWNKLISDVEVLNGVNINVFEPKIKGTNQPKTLITFLRKMRNGLAHQHIIPINENNEFIKIQIINELNERRDLDVVFTRTQLRNFALFIANTYLECFSKNVAPLVLAADTTKIETIN